MRSHHCEFFIVEAAWFEKDAIGDAYLADVVKFSRSAQNRQVLGRQAEHAPGLDAQRTSAVAVRECVFIALAQRFQEPCANADELFVGNAGWQ
jgi:hypothetical protein